ncbi:HNH endonuclease [Micromonospora sp. STR1_7]|uniref:HNH endonuclease n=1 Tax=Micromonospora parastrephiae TaxID=2806101 RepID=A0ABS1XX76_9ACTN|nr:HNH endonuclease [Micromonospora parastrephiae]
MLVERLGPRYVRDSEGDEADPLLHGRNLTRDHLDPYDGPATNQVSNGILLRADLHNLLDRGLIWIDESYVLHVSTGNQHYSSYDGKRLRLPATVDDLPDLGALLRHKREVARIP